MATFDRGQSTDNVCWAADANTKRAKSRPTSSRRTATETSADQHIARLTQTVESQIIPRLLLANSHAAESTTKAIGQRKITKTDEDFIFQATLNSAHREARAHIAGLLANGADHEAIFLDLLAPVAQRLGDGWLDDTLNFASVTIGLASLQQLLRDFSPQFESRVGVRPHGRQAILMTAPEEQHSFGLFMVEAFFRRAAWSVLNPAQAPITDLVELLRKNTIDIVGISMSGDQLLDDLASDITRLRRASRNKNLTVLVGGAAFINRPDRVIRVGADATAADAKHAVWQATKAVARTNGH